MPRCGLNPIALLKGDFVMPTLAELQAEADSRGLVRKVQRAVGLLAPMDVDLPEALTGEDSLPVDLKSDGYLPIGIVTPDGYTFGRDIEKDDIDALGYSSFVRSDITRVARSISFTAMETGRRNLNELMYGADLSGIAQGENGEVVFDEADLPIGSEYRFLVIASDGPAANNWILGKGFPTVKLASVGEESWAKEGAIQREITLDVFADEDLGTPVRHYLGGTAAVRYADVLGYQSGNGGVEG